jgi:hypothetical protein
MPTVAKEGGFHFVVRSRESTYEPPHVHVLWQGRNDVRINLNDGSFMDDVPKGKERVIRKAYKRHSEKSRAAWEQYHESRKLTGKG